MNYAVVETLSITGLGKAAVTDHRLNQLQIDVEAHDNVTLLIIHLNCKTLRSPYHVAAEPVNKL
ncbi:MULTISPECIES: hypothetical protein [Halobacterium]|uniref:hypothetical protein n=1 Tax=Halobacterium TaxID=2239 RepID=UPI0019665BD6|nr:MULTISPECIES: hypothetical protein [Halobacterium]MCF2164664.1 hypothetical protein [Halobacterium salinarum]MCF2166890.1 hypothetical protein [Halobacterium salinarum]QRY22770.1 hypothetical protein JT689_01710 [Halobacterium sp. GSL-19]WJK64078.1 hypothetical protein QSJ49_02650 [Halobacterium salinarum]